jgi:hypothetical protein
MASKKIVGNIVHHDNGETTTPSLEATNQNENIIPTMVANEELTIQERPT